MAQVIIERPRRGSSLPTKGKGYDRQITRLGWDVAVKSERMKLRGGASKSLNENLAPLRRFLASQVGRPWVKVHAEICRHLDRGSAVQDHVRDHLKDYVASNVMVQGDKLCHGDGYGIGRPLGSLFYVCPRTGILKRNRRVRSLFHFPIQPLTIFAIDDKSSLVRYRGFWHVIAWHDLSLPAVQFAWDALLQRNLYHHDALRTYGRAVYAAQARQATKREIHAIVSSYPRTNLTR